MAKRRRLGALLASLLLLILPTAGQALIATEGDCFVRLFKAGDSKFLLEQARGFRELANEILEKREPLSGRAEGLIRMATQRSITGLSYTSWSVATRALDVAETLSKIGPEKTKGDWPVLVTDWSRYLSAVATEYERRAGWFPCGVRDEARALGSDLSLIGFPVAVTAGMVTGGKETREWWPLYVGVMPYVMVRGAVTLAGDLATLPFNLAGRAIKTKARSNQELTSVEILAQIESRLDAYGGVQNAFDGMRAHE